MRYIYVDEAGTSANEPVTVVVGVIFDADREWNQADRMIAEILTRVPPQFRKNFVFHAKSVWGDPKYRYGWDREDRFDLIKSMCQVPRRLGAPIAVGKIRREAGGQDVLENFELPMTSAEWHHYRAFAACLVRADAYVREWCGADEVATVIAEDIPSMKTRLRESFKVAKVFEIPDYILEKRLTKEEKKLGIRKQRAVWRIERIKDGVHFAGKLDAPLLQIADACAFAFRRFFAGQSEGQKLVDSMLGATMVSEDWAGPESHALFRPIPLPEEFSTSFRYSYRLK